MWDLPPVPMEEGPEEELKLKPVQLVSGGHDSEEEEKIVLTVEDLQFQGCVLCGRVRVCVCVCACVCVCVCCLMAPMGRIL